MRHFITIALLSFVVSTSFSQDCVKYTGEFNSATIVDVFNSIEAYTSLNVHINSTDASIDTLQITSSYQDECITAILDGILSEYNYFTIIYKNNVLITKDTPILQVTENFVTDTIQTDTTNNALLGFLFQQDIGASDNKDEVLELGNKLEFERGKPVQLSGYVKEKNSGEVLIGAVIFIEKPFTSAITNQFGYYSLMVPSGKNTVKLSYSGMKDIAKSLIVYSEDGFDFNMEENIIGLDEIIVTADKDRNIEQVQMGVERIDISTMKNVPKILGENDLIKVALTLPGVKTVGEGSQGFNVRGGNADQNLVILNNSPIYNTAHFFGFFSVFNADVVKGSELFKSSIPVNYGGRLSSVMDVESRDGNQNKIAGKGGISPISARLTVDVPIIKDKLSIVAGGRSTYSDWILKRVKNDKVSESRATFNDIAARIKYNIDESSAIYVNGYRSFDSFNLLSDSVFSYSNNAASIKYLKVVSPQLEWNVVGSYSGYEYNINYDEKLDEAFDIGYKINEVGIKAEVDQVFDLKNNFNYGFESKVYSIDPGSRTKSSAESLVLEESLENEKSVEAAVFFSDQIELNPDVSIYGGLRYSMYGNIGPKESFSYDANFPKDIASITDTTTLDGVYNFYHGPELRLSLRYSLDATSSIKTSYNRTRQYINLLSNTTSISPIDIWKLSDEHIQPQIADQISLGYYKNFKSGLIETSVEVYYKKLQNILDYKVGSQLILNQSIEADVLQGNGKSYGIEVLAKKKSGKLNGWISYSYSRSLLKIDGDFPIETVNRGEFFPTNFDKPHDFSVVSNYKFNRRVSFSMNVKFSSGRPITYPLAQYIIGGKRVIHYSDRNEFRIPNYFRIDLGVNFEGNHKSDKIAHGFWSFSIYNLTGRNNAYSVYFETTENQVKAYKLSIFADAIPTLTYNFSF